MPRPTSNVWDHYLVLSENGIKKHVTCNYCNIEYKFAQAPRLKEHLVKCDNCPKDVKKYYKSRRKIKRFDVIECSPKSMSTSSTQKQTIFVSAGAAVKTRTTSTSTNATDATNDSELNITSMLPFPLSSTKNCRQITRAEIDTILDKASEVPLTLVKFDYWQVVFKLLNPSYTVPS